MLLYNVLMLCYVWRTRWYLWDDDSAAQCERIVVLLYNEMLTVKVWLKKMRSWPMWPRPCQLGWQMNSHTHSSLCKNELTLGRKERNTYILKWEFMRMNGEMMTMRWSHRIIIMTMGFGNWCNFFVNKPLHQEVSH